MQQNDMLCKPEVARVKAFGPGLYTITVNELTCFTVESFDVEPAEVEITIEGPDESPAYCKEGKKGKFVVSYMAAVAGELICHF